MAHTPSAPAHPVSGTKPASQPPSETDLDEVNRRAAAAEIAYFRAIPWCAALLSPPNQQQQQQHQPRQQPVIVVDQSRSRRLKPDHQDTLISRTLNSPDAIPAYVTFYTPPPTPTASGSPADPRPPPPALVREVHALVALGHMVNGFDGVCHGGLVATLLDEVMGQVFAANRERGALPRLGPGPAAGAPAMTAYLHTTYLRPVRTGRAGGPAAVVLVTARLVRRDGRKFWMEGEVRGEEEGRVLLARAEALFVMLREKL